MKKRIQYFILTLVVMIIFSNLIQAQKSAFGVKAGFVNSGFWGENTEIVNRKNGLSAGLFFSFSPGLGIFTLQPEFLFAQKGASNTIPILNIKEEIRLNYLEVPLLFKLAIPIDQTFFPHVFAGPYSAFKISESYNAVQLDTGLGSSYSREVNGLDYGAIFGAGLDVKGERFVFSLDGRFGLGANELEKANEPDDIKNGTFSFNVGFGTILK